RFHGHVCLQSPTILGTIQHRASKVRAFDGIEVDNINCAHTDKCQVLQYFTSQSACTDNKHTGTRQFRLFPPADQPQASIAIVIIDIERSIRHELFLSQAVRRWSAWNPGEARVQQIMSGPLKKSKL